MKKNDPNTRVRLHAKILLIMVIVFVAATAEQSHRLRQARSELDRLVAKQAEAAKRSTQENQYQQTLREQAQVLQTYEAQLPFVDGYVWLSKFLRETAPGLQLAVNPPDMGGQPILMLNEYCTGSFRIRGTGGKEDLLHLLRQIETDLPFARVQDVQFVFNDNSRSQVQFTFAVMLIMRLHEDPAATRAQVVAFQKPSIK